MPPAAAASGGAAAAAASADAGAEATGEEGEEGEEGDKGQSELPWHSAAGVFPQQRYKHTMAQHDMLTIAANVCVCFFVLVAAPVGNGGFADGYTWTQTLQEVVVHMPIPPKVKGRDIVYKLTPTKLTVGVRGAKPAIDVGHVCVRYCGAPALAKLNSLTHIRHLIAPNAG